MPEQKKDFHIFRVEASEAKYIGVFSWISSWGKAIFQRARRTLWKRKHAGFRWREIRTTFLVTEALFLGFVRHEEKKRERESE